MGDIKYIYSSGSIYRAEILEAKDKDHTMIRYPDRSYLDPVPVLNKDLFDTEEGALTNIFAHKINEIHGYEADIRYALENIHEVVTGMDSLLSDYWAHKRAEKQKKGNSK